VETKRFVGSFVHVILTGQTCGQRSSKVTESKRRVLGNYFSERICYVFLVSKCREESDLGLCTSSGLTFGEPQRNDKIRFFLRGNTFFPRKSPLRLGSPNASPEVVHRPTTHWQEWTNRTPINHEPLICSKMCFTKNRIGPIIRPNGTIFYSVLYLNLAKIYIRLIYVYSVISVNDKRLPGNTKKWTLVRSWLIGVRLVHSWAGC